MSAAVWRAVCELAEIWRASPVVRNYSVVTSGDPTADRKVAAYPVLGQPLLLGGCLYVTPGAHAFWRSDEGRKWLECAEAIGQGYLVLVEWLRSRLPGYPFDESPQLSQSSPWLAPYALMRAPWLPQRHALNLHARPTAPTMPFLNTNAEDQMSAGNALGAAVRASPQAARLGSGMRALSDRDRRQLAIARAALDEAKYFTQGEADYDEDFRRAGWAETQLAAVMRPLNGLAREYAEALDDAERLIQQAASLFTQLAVNGRIRTIGGVVNVEQLTGHGGWHSIRAKTFLLPSVDLGEIVGFEHPHPRGLMLVEGVNENWDPGNFTLTLRGYVLSDSHYLGPGMQAS